MTCTERSLGCYAYLCYFAVQAADPGIEVANHVPLSDGFKRFEANVLLT